MKGTRRSVGAVIRVRTAARNSLLVVAAVSVALTASTYRDGGAQPAVTPTAQPALGAAAPSGCGRALATDLSAGKTASRKLTSGGQERTYLLHVPSGYDVARPAPVVLNFHGLGSNAVQQETYSGFGPISDREGFILVNPDGINNRWSTPPDLVDVAFTRDLVAGLRNELCVDPSRVFATGFSRGAHLSSWLGCAAGELVAAIAPVAAVSEPVATCGPLPILQLHGTADGVVPFNGGDIGWGPFAGVLPVMASWARHNGCSNRLVEERVSPRVKRLSYSDCKAETVHYVIESGGHGWPRPPMYDISASELAWAFFKAHPKP